MNQTIMIVAGVVVVWAVLFVVMMSFQKSVRQGSSNLMRIMLIRHSYICTVITLPLMETAFPHFLILRENICRRS